MLDLVVFPTERRIDLLAALDRLHELRARAPHHQADRMLAVATGMRQPLAEHTVSFAAAASAAEEDFEHPALQQPHLGRVATRGPGNPNLGLGDHGAIFSSAPPPRSKASRRPSLQLIGLVLDGLG